MSKSVNGYLTSLASQAIIRDAEKQSIQRSIAYLQQKLNIYFGGQVDNHFMFGSYVRGTILPRTMDQNSDIDYMVVFKNDDLHPQAYLARLRRFVQQNYQRSEIKQSNPTIVLNLNHIKFELVPAVNDWWSGLQIPARAADVNNWINTDPTDFNNALVKANKENNNLTKPLVRLLKYWNALNSYVYESYELEKYVVSEGFYMLALFGDFTLENMFYEFIESMSWDWTAPQWKVAKIQKAQSMVAEIREFQRVGNALLAHHRIQKLLPPIQPAGILV